MAFTETEAAAKVCPPISSGCAPGEFVVCEGSRCMWWRWIQGPAMGFRPALPIPGGTGYERPQGCPESWQFVDDEERGPGYLEPEVEWTAKRRGYCAAVPRG